ncbi:MAG: ATP-dependent DNA helicase RecG [Nitrospirae bacterium]|nr:ATP-dependent DNA helicase RecG [Nitrospirota bacterium]
MEFHSDIQYVKGVGPARVRLFNRLGLFTVEDLLYYFPFRYEDRGNLTSIKELYRSSNPGFTTVQGKIVSAMVVVTPRQRKKIFEAVIGDETGYITAKWFNQSFLKDVLRKGTTVVVSGHVKSDYRGSGICMEGPEYEVIGSEDNDLIHTGRIVPVYHVTNGLSQKTIRAIIKGVLDSTNIPEMLSPEILVRYNLPELNNSINDVHFPPEGSALDSLNNGETLAYKRLVFEEFFLLEAGLALKKGIVLKESGTSFEINDQMTEKLYSLLPFKLTDAQQRVISEIKEDMTAPHPMNRLLQGDVGCGKTVVALWAMLMAVENDYQSVIMAPTGILAEQHYRNIKKYLDTLGIPSALLTGSIKPGEKSAILDDIANGRARIIVGTHALLEEGVKFQRLGLSVIDEQHKFGVLQRAALKKKGYSPDVLIMTATPIPRTLALTVYGDLNLSVIDELPPERTPVQTRWLYGKNRKDAFYIMQEELGKGRQVYVIYPLVEESEKVDLKGAVEMAEKLREAFKGYNTGLLHGRMKNTEKEMIMEDFKNNNIHILVSTTVVEVGIDVPNATAMVIEHAERFGLSQLHQLRGRVGRGGGKSCCLLLTDGFISEDGRRRLTVMERTNNGFEIAEEDLSIRGPGDFFGTRQAGLPELKVANILRNSKVLETARREAFDLVAKDPMLTHPDHKVLRNAIERRWKDKLILS